MKIVIITFLYLLIHLTSCVPIEDDLSEHDIEKRGVLRTVKCYGDEIGCFTVDGWYFVGRPVNLFPADRNVINTRFNLYTRRNRDVRQQIKAGVNKTVIDSNFDANKPTKFVVHGFLDHGGIYWAKDIAKEFLIHEDVNVFSVDWGNAAGFPYTQAAANTRLVGREIALIVNFLMKYFGLKPDDVHLIGHSLGAHICGYAGEKLREDGTPIARISGLDPAEPLFQYTAPFVHLDPTDAKYVDIMHSDTRSILRLGYGMSIPVGHIDIFPNGGKVQPGCDQSVLSHIIIEGIFGGIRQSVACNHLRAIDFFKDSINSVCPFLAIECPSYSAFKNGECWDCGKNNEHCAEMGNNGDKYQAGNRINVNMYVDTAERIPYCLYHYQVEVKLDNNGNAKDQTGKMFITIYGDKAIITKAILSPETKTFKHGETYKFTFTNPKDVGKITRIEFFWQYFGQILNPITWGIFRKPLLYVDRINVRSITRQNGALFCDKRGAAEQDVHRVLYPKEVCS